MNPVSLQLLATGFTVVAALLGVPSLIALVGCGIRALAWMFSAPPTSPSSFGDNPDAILRMLQGMTVVAGWMARASGALTELLVKLLAVGATVGLMLAIACWWTGRGLRVGSEGARVLAGILLLLPLLLSLVLALSLPGPLRLLLCGVIVVCVLGLHAVWTGYAPGVSQGGVP
ncbi:MAG: hypothetical protein JNL10_00540 [Verrucomicrobiales bacterium]|nr:hypothetical protein [Verrucomicrobiales bacterium]